MGGVRPESVRFWCSLLLIAVRPPMPVLYVMMKSYPFTTVNPHFEVDGHSPLCGSFFVFMGVLGFTDDAVRNFSGGCHFAAGSLLRSVDPAIFSFHTGGSC